ncbi:MAG: sigma-70 family RNA polymerase sigma factor, partial [Candidatus Poribacteria bacterium]
MRSTTLSFIPVREYVTMSRDANERETLDAWLEQAQRHPLLTRQEEIEISQRIKAQDGTARERLILCNLRLVLKIALAYRRANVPLVDLLQEGIGGLMQAVEHFDEQRGFKFSTYAVHWIRQAISRYIDRTARTIRLPSYIIADMSQQNRASTELEQSLERAPTPEELAERLEKTKKQIRNIQMLPEEPVPLGAPVGGEDSTTTLSDVVEDA